MEKNNNQKQIAGAIIIAGLIIAGAILLKGSTAVAPNSLDNKANIKNIKIEPVSINDHILGNPDAKIVIVEYSDSECPFCKIFHTTMYQVITKYDGKVAWVYRHYPIVQLHPKAFNESVAMECASEQGGNDTFWKYTDELYVRTTSNNRLDVTELPKIAKDIGLDLISFNDCLTNEKTKGKVQADMDSGNKAGVNGTPKSFILKNGKIVDTIDGAEPIENIIQKIDKIL
ncbi:MAG: thioredoxin domain-containing protein [Candidatus Paceibacterota bacterium]